MTLNDQLQVQSTNDQIRTYDDLPMISHDGFINLQCPICGPVETPKKAPTLSDFTNAAIEHLETYHLKT